MHKQVSYYYRFLANKSFVFCGWSGRLGLLHICSCSFAS